MIQPPVQIARGPRGGRPKWNFLHPKQMEVFTSRARFRTVVAGRRWGKCIAQDEMIEMADGTQKPVQDVKAGDMVLTANEDTYEIEPRPVQAVADNGVKETVIIRTNARSLRVTPNHPILANNRWINAGMLKKGDLVAVPKSTVFGVEALPDYEVDLLSIWLAEGSEYTITNKTPEIVTLLHEIGEKIGVIPVAKDGLNWRFFTGVRKGPKNGSQNPLRQIMERYGVFKLNSKTKFIPDAIFKLPEDQLARFLNLFVACDGSISRRSKSTYSLEVGLANERMVRQISSLFAKFGIHGQVRHKVHSAKSSKTGDNFESWTFVASGADAIQKFATRIGATSKEAAVRAALEASLKSKGSSNRYLPVSHDNFITHLNCEARDVGKFGGYNAAVKRGLPEDIRLQLNSWRKQTPSRISVRRYEAIRAYSDGFFDPIADGGLAWEEIVSVEVADEIATYDLSLAGNHNFIASGIVTHNTQLSKISIIRAAQKPKSLIWYIAPTYQMARQIMWRELIDSVPRKWIKGKPNESRLEIELKNGSVIALKGADKPDTLRGVGLDFVVLDEFQDMKEDVWTLVIQPTLTSTGGRALFIGTPKAFNHLYENYMLGQSASEPAWASWQFKTITSPFIPPEEIAQARRTMSDKEFAQEFEASFETMSNRVYHAFDRNVHVRRVTYDPALPIIVGMDFNINPMSAVLMQKKNDKLYVFDEIILDNSNTFEMSEELERRHWRVKKKIKIYPDPAGKQKSTSSVGESDFSILKKKGFGGLVYRRKHPRVRDRINAVNRMLMSGDGTVRIYIDHSCKGLIRSFEQTQYKKNTSDIDKAAGMEHATDAIGYPIDLLYPVKTVKVMGVSV